MSYKKGVGYVKVEPSIGNSIADRNKALREEIEEMEAVERREEIVQKLEAICGPKVHIRDEAQSTKVDTHWDNVMKEMV